MIWMMLSHYADKVIVMDKGQVVFHDGVEKVFSNHEQLEKWHLDVPVASRFQMKLENETDIKLQRVCLTVDELADALVEVDLHEQAHFRTLLSWRLLDPSSGPKVEITFLYLFYPLSIFANNWETYILLWLFTLFVMYFSGVSFPPISGC